jgi:ABC-type transport system substrate-binding protein
MHPPDADMLCYDVTFTPTNLSHMMFRRTSAPAAAFLLILLGWISATVFGFSTLSALADPVPEKTLHLLLTGTETGLDPATASDLNTLSLNENIFEPLLRYDYLARPVALQPNTTRAIPTISADGLTYVFHLQPGIYFTPDPAFKGRQRELVAADYVFSIKRLYDPALKSPWLFLFDGKIAGDTVLRPATAARFNYDVPVPGLQALDRYTLQITLTATDSNFLFYLAMPATAALAREVIAAYPDQTGNHPVGSGPFMVGEWQRSNRIVLLANPHYHVTAYQANPASIGHDPESKAIASALEGQRLPRVARIDIKIIEEQQTRVLSFLRGEFDYLEQTPPNLSSMILTAHGALKPALQRQGIGLNRFTPLQTYYMWMNMDDPVLGGYQPEQVGLRRAIALSYDRDADIQVIEKRQALAAQSLLPPNVLGYDAAYRSPVGYDPALARALLDHFGYQKRDAEGFRTRPDGQALTLVMHTVTAAEGRVRDEVWRKSLAAIGLRVVFKSDKRSEIIKASRLGAVQMFETNWIADFPDGDNFFQLLYGANAGRANYARFNLPAYNRLYEQARLLHDSPERQRLYHDMTQLIHAYNPWVLRIHPVSLDLSQPWLKNLKRHPVEFTAWRYLDLDVRQRAAARAK